MKYYKELLLKQLTDSGWELVAEHDDTDWWLESAWQIRSIKQSYGLEIYVLFLVDPGYEGQHKSSAVWAVGAFAGLPSSRPLNNGIKTVSLSHGKLKHNIV